MDFLYCIFTENNVDIVNTNPIILDQDYFEIIITYASNTIRNLTVKYVMEKEVMIHQINLLEIPLYDKLQELYKYILNIHPELIQDLKSFPGTNDFKKFVNYYISGISVILSLFGLLQSHPKILGSHGVVFPELDIDINLLNNKFYTFFDNYINIFQDQSTSILKEVFKYIIDYWKIFGSSLNVELSPEDSRYQDMMCSYSSVITYSKFMEHKFQDFTQQVNGKIQDLDKIKVQKDKEFGKIYNEEILQLVEKTASLKNMHQDLIQATKDLVIRNREDVETQNKKMYENNLANSKKQLEEFLENKKSEFTQNYELMIKSHKSEIDVLLLNLENKCINKIKSELVELTNKKTGLLQQIEKKKAESLDELISEKNTSLVEIKKLKEDLLTNSDTLSKNLNSINLNLGIKITEFEKDLDDKLNRVYLINSKLEERLQEFDELKFDAYWRLVEPKIKKQSELIIQKTFDEILSKISPTLEQMINSIISNRNKKY
jgi:hypothetical protein